VRTPRLLGLLSLSAVLIACNWLLYIVSVARGQVVQASMGYFLTPILSVIIGLIVLGEKMRPLQWIAACIAASGCLLMIAVRQEVPYLGLSLAGSFALYGLVRKVTPVDGLMGLTIETLLLSPLALGCILVWQSQGTLELGAGSRSTDWLLVGSGLVTAFPLLAFGQAARRLPLSSLGFIQFVSPSIQFLIAVTALGEVFDLSRAAGFIVIWTGVAVFVIDLWRAHFPRHELPMEPE
jgi:chloramphenicol-sensitive protein RarD